MSIKIVRINTVDFWTQTTIDEKTILKKIEEMAEGEWELISTAPNKSL